MNLLGFNFTKINIEKNLDKVNDIKINTNVEIIDILEAKTDIFKSEDSIIAVKFEYNINYTPDFAKINFEGNLVLSMPKNEVKEIIDKWKDKKLTENIKLTTFNIILNKCNVKAFELEDEMGLPLHMQLFKLKKQENTDSD